MDFLYDPKMFLVMSLSLWTNATLQRSKCTLTCIYTYILPAVFLTISEWLPGGIEALLSFGFQAEIVDIRVDSYWHWLHIVDLPLLKLLHLDHAELSVQQRPFRLQLCFLQTISKP